MNTGCTVSVIGLGNKYRRDDGVGLSVIENIRSGRLSNVKLVDNIADDASLIESWKDNDIVYIVDAASSKSGPGEIFRYEPLKEEIPAGLFPNFSTHSLNLIQAIELAKILDRLPELLVVFGIEGQDFSSGAGLSSEVEKAALKVSGMITKEIGELSKNRIRI